MSSHLAESERTKMIAGATCLKAFLTTTFIGTAVYAITGDSLSGLIATKTVAELINNTPTNLPGIRPKKM